MDSIMIPGGFLTLYFLVFTYSPDLLLCDGRFLFGYNLLMLLILFRRFGGFLEKDHVKMIRP